MAHTAQPAGGPNRTREIIVGIAFVAIAIVLVFVVIIALRHPKGPHAPRASGSDLSSSSALASDATGSGPPATSSSSAPTTSPVGTTSPTTTPPTSSATAPPPTSSAATSVAPVAGRVPVVVLNNTAPAGSTALAVSRFQGKGWVASDGGTFEGDIISTAAYYNPNTVGARTDALQLQQEFPAIQRVLPAFTGLPDDPIVVVLTTGYS